MNKMHKTGPVACVKMHATEPHTNTAYIFYFGKHKRNFPWCQSPHQSQYTPIILDCVKSGMSVYDVVYQLKLSGSQMQITNVDLSSRETRIVSCPAVALG